MKKKWRRVQSVVRGKLTAPSFWFFWHLFGYIREAGRQIYFATLINAANANVVLVMNYKTV